MTDSQFLSIEEEIGNISKDIQRTKEKNAKLARKVEGELHIIQSMFGKQEKYSSLVRYFHSLMIMLFAILFAAFILKRHCNKDLF